MTHDELKRLELTATAETPGILFGLCRDETTGVCYGGGTGFCVSSTHPRDIVAIAETSSSDPKSKNGEPPATLFARERWTCHESYVSSLVWDEGVVVSGGFDGRIAWTGAASGTLVRTVAAHEGWVRKVVRCPQRKLIASAGDDMRVRLWNTEDGTLAQTLEGHANQTPEGYATALYALDAHPDGRHLAAADRAGHVLVWNLESGQIVQRWRAPEFYTFDAAKRARAIGGIRALAFSPDGASLALGGIGPVSNVDGFVGPCRLEVWNWSKPERTFLGQDKHQAILNDVAWLPDGTLAGAGGGDGGGILAFWDGRAEAPIHKLKPKGHLQRIAVDATNKALAAAGAGGFQFWNVGAAPSAK